MRLFPPTQPENGHHHESTTFGEGSIGIVAGLSFVAAGLAFRRDQVGSFRALLHNNKTLALLTKGVAYGAAATIPVALHSRYVEQRRSAKSIRSETAALPKTVYVDRLSHFDIDNAIILGGLTGALIASRLRRPGSVVGLRRYASAIVIGTATPTIAFWSYESVKNSGNESTWIPSTSKLVVRPSCSDLEFPSLSDLIHSALDRVSAGDEALATEGPQRERSHDGSSLAMLGMPRGSNGDSSGSGGSWAVSSGLAGPQVQLEILTDGPHIAVKQGNKDPEVQPQTNYGWYSNNKIAELEAHIATMRTRRLRLSHEAEVVWAWLSEKEAKHLEKFPVTKKAEEGDEDPSDAAVESSMIVQSLNQVHARIWREASVCDWIIADSQKRIAQEKSLAAKGRVDWRPSCSEAASSSPLEVTLEVLKNNAEVQASLKNHVDQALSSLTMSLGDPYADLNAKAMHPIKKEMATQKEIIKDVREHMEEQKRRAELFGKTLKKAIEEAESKAGKGN